VEESEAGIRAVCRIHQLCFIIVRRKHDKYEDGKDQEENQFVRLIAFYTVYSYTIYNNINLDIYI
jgi:hypothetical protein